MHMAGTASGHRAGHMRHHMAKVDANGDGEITLDEVRARRAERFAKMDTNSDGIIEKSEIEARIKARMEKRMQRRVVKLTRRFDKDRDGKITKEEFNQSGN